MSILISRSLPLPFMEPPKPGTTATYEPVRAKSVREEFLEYAQMTPAERMEAALLSEMGLTKEEFEAMSPEAKKAIAEEIRERIKKQVENGSDRRTGMITDISA